jgi:TonB-linked SusC/RagA family outer membrane protein
MKSKLTRILTPLLVLCVSFAFGQKTVSGKVTDSSGLPLPGVSVVLVGTSQGTQTDFDGNYSISANVGQVLRFSYLGQKTVNRTVSSSTTVINVQMEDDAERLTEVVVQGYRTAAKTKSSIAATTVSAETIENRPNASIVQTLSGQVAGLQISTTSGQPGANSIVQLRGVNSINGNTEPLFIIDGTPVNEDNFRSLNPQDIVSVSVLKDAGATAIYGNRGANGVIVIKTRNGNFDQPLEIRYTGILSYTSLQDAKYDLLNSQQQLGLERQQGAGRGATLTEAEIASFPTFDWVDYFFRTGLTQNHTLTLTSGGSKTTQFTSLGYYDQEGVLVNSDLKRFNLRNNITGKSDNGKFNYGTNVSINYSQSNEPNNIGGSGINRNFVIGAYQSVPYITADDYTNGEDLLSPLLFSNTPLFLVDLLRTFSRREDEVKIIGSVNASYEFMKNVRANVTMSADYESEFRTRAEASDSFNALLFGGAANPLAGFQEQTSNRTFTYNQVTSLTYDNSWGKHSISAGAYAEYFKAHFKNFGFFGEGIDPKTFAPGDGASFVDDNPDNDFFVDNIFATLRNAGLFSYFGQADYDYDEKYGIVGTVRRDASYRFAGSNRWATFWSVAARWNLDNEDFLADSNVVNLLKLRASYGTAGNQRIAGGTYFTAPDLTQNFFATGTGYGGQNSLFLSQIGNTTLRWETVTQANVGVDFELFDSRLRGALDAYHKETSDLFQSTPVSAINATTAINANTGTLVNQGIDLSLNWDVIRSNSDNGLNLTLNFVGNYNENELGDIPNEEGFLIGTGRNGGPLGEYFRVRYAGVNPANGNLLFLDADGNITENPDADTDRVWLGKNLIPDYNGSFGFNLDWNGFFVTTQFNYVIGVDRDDFDYSSFINPDNIGQFRHSTDILQAWTPDNRITDIPRLNAPNRNTIGGNATASDRFLTSTDFVRLRFASIGYNFPKRYLENTGIKRLSIFANGENILTFTKWRGFDAEARSNTSRLYPTPAIYSFGFEIGL